MMVKNLISVLKANKLYEHCHIVYVKENYSFALYPILYEFNNQNKTIYDITYICNKLRRKVNFFNCMTFASYIINYNKLCEEIKSIIDEANIN